MGLLFEMGRRLRSMDERIFSEEALTPVQRPRRPRWVLASVIAAVLWLMVSIVLMLTVDNKWGVSAALATMALTGIVIGILVRDHRASRSR